MRYKTKSQLYSDAEARKKGKEQILDDCTWSSCAAAVSFASGYTVEYSSADGVAAQKAALNRVDRQGVSDNGGSLAEAVKVIAKLGGKARYAKSWDDAMTAMKTGAALIMHVQQAVGYPPEVKISKWHDSWHRWWSKHQPAKITAGYGHCTSAGLDQDTGTIYWTCPTRDEKVAAEAYGAPVTEAQLRQIANSKVKAKKGYKVDYKTLLIVTHPGGQVAVQAPVAPAPVAPVVAAPTAPVSATQSAVVSTPAPAPVPTKKEAQIDPALSASVDALKRVDWGAKAGEAAEAIGNAVESTKGQSGMNRVLSVLKSIKDNTGIDEAATEAARVFLTTCIAMMLATGSPLLDMTSGDFRVVISGGLSACLNVVVRFLQPTDNQFGVKTKEK
jgi:hypothetical protein